jgi:Cu(I)/Ag(I) efflux system membrane fusion protein
MNQQKILMVLMGILLLMTGAIGGWWWARQTTTHEQTPPSAQQEQQVLYWYDPMQPQQHFDKPGKSPFMDMELVPKYADEGEETAGVKIDPAVTQNLGVRLAAVTRIPLATQIEATGIIGFNERDVALVQTRSSGFVERVWPLAPGDVIKAGQPLVELLVPEWSAAQHELLAVKKSGDETLISAARERLRLLGMAEESIREVEQSGTVRSRFTISAPIAGVIQSLDVRSGMTVMTGQGVARINGLKTVWLEAAVPETLANAVREGAVVAVRLAGFTEQPLKGRVTAILPALNEAARTLRVRIELPNRDGRLRPGLSAQVTLTGSSKESALAVPTEAIIRTGKRALVMVASDQSRFTPVEVTLGAEVGNQTVIATGVSEGQQVVASGQFLIDSEASLKGVAARGAHAGGHP